MLVKTQRSPRSLGTRILFAGALVLILTLQGCRNKLEDVSAKCGATYRVDDRTYQAMIFAPSDVSHPHYGIPAVKSGNDYYAVDEFASLTKSNWQDVCSFSCEPLRTQVEEYRSVVQDAVASTTDPSLRARGTANLQELNSVYSDALSACRSRTYIAHGTKRKRKKFKDAAARISAAKAAEACVCEPPSSLEHTLFSVQDPAYEFEMNFPTQDALISTAPFGSMEIGSTLSTENVASQAPLTQGSTAGSLGSAPSASSSLGDTRAGLPPALGAPPPSLNGMGSSGRSPASSGSNSSGGFGSSPGLFDSSFSEDPSPSGSNPYSSQSMSFSGQGLQESQGGGGARGTDRTSGQSSFAYESQGSSQASKAGEGVTVLEFKGPQKESTADSDSTHTEEGASSVLSSVPTHDSGESSLLTSFGSGETYENQLRRLASQTSRATSTYDDPVDYFSRIRIEESIFDRIAERYQSLTQTWSRP